MEPTHRNCNKMTLNQIVLHQTFGQTITISSAESKARKSTSFLVRRSEEVQDLLSFGPKNLSFKSDHVMTCEPSDKGLIINLLPHPTEPNAAKKRYHEPPRNVEGPLGLQVLEASPVKTNPAPVSKKLDFEDFLDLNATTHMGHKVLSIENKRRHYVIRKQNCRTGKAFTVMICKFARCRRIFNKSSNLLDHLNMHEGVRPFGCLRCGKTFTQVGNLTKHQATCDLRIKNL
jgi:hypothetical protein